METGYPGLYGVGLPAELSNSVHSVPLGVRPGIPEAWGEAPMVRITPLRTVDIGPGQPLVLSYPPGDPLRIRFHDPQRGSMDTILPGRLTPPGPLWIETESPWQWNEIERQTPAPLELNAAVVPPAPTCAVDLNVAAGISPMVSSDSRTPGTFRGGWRGVVGDDGTVRYTLNGFQPKGPVAVVLRGDMVNYRPGLDGPAAELRIRNGDSQSVFHVRPVGPAFAVSIPIEVVPTAMDVDWTVRSDISITDMEIIEISGSCEPLPVDPGFLVSLAALSAPREDFGLYSWAARPEVTLLVFRDYDIQSRYLKRLAFFAEKPGTRGRLLTDLELSGVHGWNAHDYPPETLAAFFNTAEKSRFRLSIEENDLKNIAECRGLIAKNGGEWAAGEGALISISLESEPWLREVFLAHELAHAVYFLDATWRRETERIWDSLTDEQRSLWRSFLAWARYDPEDEDLMQNEFQSYLLQRPVEDAASYWGWKIGVLRGSAATMRDRVLRNDPDFFVRLAREADAAFQDLTGYRAGRFSAVRRVGSEASVISPGESVVPAEETAVAR